MRPVDLRPSKRQQLASELCRTLMLGLIAAMFSFLIIIFILESLIRPG